MPIHSSDVAILNGITTVVPANGLAAKLNQARQAGKFLHIKLGFDPTAPDLHLGHAVVLRKLKAFQDAGHTIHIIIGDFTARIGDPTGRNTSRPPLDENQVATNAKTYIDQLSALLDVSRVKVHFNSTWFSKMTFTEVIKLLAENTLAQIMQRNDFATRFEHNVPICLHELVYPIMQGYDSVMVNADVEIGGTDQLFNCMVGKYLQDTRGLPSQVVVCMPILVGTDGKEKMSKSKGNYIGLTESPAQMYAKVMSIPDAILPDYIKLASSYDHDTQVSETDSLKAGANPMEIKKRLAFDIVRTYHNADLAAQAQEAFYNNVQSRNLESREHVDVDFVSLGFSCDEDVDLVTLCSAITGESKSQIRRLIESGGVSVNGGRVPDSKMRLPIDECYGIKLKIGKRGFYRILAKDAK